MKDKDKVKLKDNLLNNLKQIEKKLSNKEIKKLSENKIKALNRKLDRLNKKIEKIDG